MEKQRIILDYDPDGLQVPNFAPIISDVSGSYSGRPVDPYETPLQDADDL